MPKFVSLVRVIVLSHYSRFQNHGSVHSRSLCCLKLLLGKAMFESFADMGTLRRTGQLPLPGLQLAVCTCT
jgi:hypothetical protein